jgi:[Skp1-protein]-hydroxyproline N-acetylglucosaminyltransferase
LGDIHDIETLQHTFPIHVGDDMEEIHHPGMFMADPAKMKKVLKQHSYLPIDGNMRVPKFWRPVAYGPEGVRAFLGEHGKRLVTPEEAAQVGSYRYADDSSKKEQEELETIYISVASYRDPECQPTVEDIFLRAEHPERLRVAIIDQRAENDPVPPCGEPVKPCSQDPQQAMCRFAHLIDVYDVLAPLSIGPVFARHLANRMYRGEYFAMQVDLHVRFIHDWDSNIIAQWKSAANEMAVLSVYLSDITDSIDPVTFENNHPTRPIMCKTDYESFGKMRHLRHGQQPEGAPGIHGEPTLHPFWAAGFSFARGHFVVQVPYDQYQPMVFQGEEIFMGLRGFTYGYDYYTPEVSVAFHMYAVKENKEKRKQVKLFWENQNLYPESAVAGMRRLNGIIGMGDPEDKYYHGQEEEYGLGYVRSTEKFFKLYGIHTDTKTVEDHLCTFVGKPMQRLFVPHLRKNRMGIDVSQIDYEWKDPNPVEKSNHAVKK